jgi:hypothetical protein
VVCWLVVDREGLGEAGREAQAEGEVAVEEPEGAPARGEPVCAVGLAVQMRWSQGGTMSSASCWYGVQGLEARCM